MNDNLRIYRVEMDGKASSIAWESGKMFYVWRDGNDPEISNFNTKQAAEQRLFVLQNDDQVVHEAAPVITAYRLIAIEQAPHDEQ